MLFLRLLTLFLVCAPFASANYRDVSELEQFQADNLVQHTKLLASKSKMQMELSAIENELHIIQSQIAKQDAEISETQKKVAASTLLPEKRLYQDLLSRQKKDESAFRDRNKNLSGDRQSIIYKIRKLDKEIEELEARMGNPEKALQAKALATTEAAIQKTALEVIATRIDAIEHDNTEFRLRDLAEDAEMLVREIDLLRNSPEKIDHFIRRPIEAAQEELRLNFIEAVVLVEKNKLNRVSERRRARGTLQLVTNLVTGGAGAFAMLLGSPVAGPVVMSAGIVGFLVGGMQGSDFDTKPIGFWDRFTGTLSFFVSPVASAVNAAILPLRSENQVVLEVLREQYFTQALRRALYINSSKAKIDRLVQSLFDRILPREETHALAIRNCDAAVRDPIGEIQNQLKKLK